MSEWPFDGGPAMPLSQIPSMTVYLPPFITLTEPKTHAKREPRLVTLRVDQILGWAAPFEVPYFGPDDDVNQTTTCTKVFVQRLVPEEGIEVAETPEEIIQLMLEAVNPYATGNE